LSKTSTEGAGQPLTYDLFKYLKPSEFGGEKARELPSMDLLVQAGALDLPERSSY
jgi:hypothetical protein